MNDEMKNANPNGIERKLLDVAERTNANPQFVSELESKLKDIHKPKTSWSMPLFKQTSSALGWIALAVVLGYFLNWSFATLIPTQQPGTNTTPNQFVCPVTEPNGSTPPFEQPSQYFLGNGELWTALWPDGKIYMLPTDKMPDGSFSMKWGFWRGVNGALTVEGHRLDADAEPLRADIPDGYGDTGFQVLGLIFPTTGCWEVTGRVGTSSLTFVTEVVFGEATPTPDLSTTQNTTTSEIATPAPDSAGGYTWRDTKMYLAQPLPQSPTDAQVYSLKINQPVTREDVLALAQRFGMQGELQELPPDFSNSTGYRLTDGAQKLEVQSNNYFVFYPNYTAAALGTVPEEQVRTVIDGFLKKYGFNFEYRVETAPGVSAQQYTIKPLTPDGAEIRSDFIMPVGYQVTVDGTGQVLAFSGFLLNYEALGTYPIITAEEALQDAIADHPQFGHIESFLGKNGGGGGGGPGFYKLNLGGTPVPFPTATAQLTFSSKTSEYTVQANDTLASIAANFGVATDELIKANNIAAPGVIYLGQKLIIPGLPFAAQYPYTGKRLENQRGILVIHIYRRSDGSQRKEYTFITAKDGENFNLILAGDALQDLDKYHNLPINIWATINNVDQYGKLNATLERFTIPFPDLRIQIFQGQQKSAEIKGKSAVLFITAEGKTYVQSVLNGDPFIDHSILGREGDQVRIEGIAIPDDFNNGYPVLRMFAYSLFTPKEGQAANATITTDKPYVYDENPTTENTLPPTAAIEKVELVYYLPNLWYGNTNPSTDAKYIQPAWRFYGHYSTGDQLEIFVQALKQEFLLPELASFIPPG